MAGFCTQCGNPLRDGDRFCRKCGARVEIELEEPAAPAYDDANPEGTMLFAGPDTLPQTEPEVISGKITLSVDDILQGGRKVVDFGTGDRYALDIPAGMLPGDTLVVKGTNISHPETGAPCDIELKVTI